MAPLNFSFHGLRRPLAALLCAQFLMTTSGAAETLAAPAPKKDAPVALTEPDFKAPSATNCARPIATHEIPGMVQTANRSDVHRREMLADGVAVPAPLPASPPRLMKPGIPVAPAAAVAPMPLAEESAARSMPSVAASIALPATPASNAPVVTPRPANEPVTAGMVDDNADFGQYLDFRGRTQVRHRERDIAQRYLLQVRDPEGTVVPDAEVAVRAPGGASMWARTDAAGRAWLHPDAFDPAHSHVYEVTVRKNGSQSTALLQRAQKNAVDVVLDKPGAVPKRARLDLVFLIDATGSMDDEIAKLKGTLHTIAAQVAQLPSRPDTCFGLVAYRDRTDDFMVRSHDFTNDLGAFQAVLDNLQAAGGGDYPEAMNEALHETIHTMSWRGDGATRMVVLLADAPPHLDYGGPQYDDDMLAALGKGIKVFSVGASGLDKQGEYIQRQIAQYTGGRFVFLTYKEATHPASGPGTQTVHDVANYSVQTLDKLIVRLVSEELGKLPNGA